MGFLKSKNKMVKKFTKSNLKRKSEKNEKSKNENNFYDSDEEFYDNENKENIIKEINEGYIITEKLNSAIYSEREGITSILASVEINNFDTKFKEQILTTEVCKLLVEKLTDSFIQIRFNAISAIINLIFCFQ